MKSIRNGKISIEEAYARVTNGESWLIDCDIAEYPQANLMNHMANARRARPAQAGNGKGGRVRHEKGLTLVPLSVYFSRGFVKVRLAVAKGEAPRQARTAPQKRRHPRNGDAALRRR